MKAELSQEGKVAFLTERMLNRVGGRGSWREALVRRRWLRLWAARVVAAGEVGQQSGQGLGLAQRVDWVRWRR